MRIKGLDIAKLLAQRRRVVTAVCLGVVVLVGGVYVVLHSSNLPQRADLGMVVVADDLYRTAQQLRTHVEDVLPKNTAQATDDYLSLLTRLETDCDHMVAYANRRTDRNLEEATAKSKTLCEELSRIAKQSRSLYEAARPVLAIDGSLKRYQTLPVVSSLIRQHDMSAISDAKDAIGRVGKDGGFASESVALIDKLHSSASASNGLDYYPELRAFQSTLLAERQRYWTSYADIDGLVGTLKLQLRRYCRALPSSDAPHYIATCQKTE